MLGTFRCVDSRFARIVIDDCPSPQTLVLTVIEVKREMGFVTLNVPNGELRMAHAVHLYESVSQLL
jgi:hypothetical protein